MGALNLEEELIEFEVGDYKVSIHRNDLHEELGPCTTEVWTKDGVPDSPDGRPAVISYSHDGRALLQEWYHKGMLHRDNAPAREITFNQLTDGLWSRRQEYYNNDKCTRLDGPAIQEIRSDGEVLMEQWVLDDQEHRIGGPSYILRDHQTLFAILEQWKQYGEFKRDSGAAYIERCEKTGDTISEEYFDTADEANHGYPPP